MTLHVAPGDRFFGPQRTVIWIFHSIILHVALSVVCCCMVFVNYIPHISLITMNNMALWYFFHVEFNFTFFTLFIVLQVFFFINLNPIVKMIMSLLGYCFIHICCVHPFSEEFIVLHSSQLNYRFSTAKKKIEISETLRGCPYITSY